MNNERAVEIMQSSEVIGVLYQGSSVWIENIKGNNFAEVTNIETRARMEVPVNMLVETK